MLSTFFMMGTNSARISSSSSLGNRLATSPELRMLFMGSRNVSSFMSLSVNMNVTPLPWNPEILFRREEWRRYI